MIRSRSERVWVGEDLQLIQGDCLDVLFTLSRPHCALTQLVLSDLPWGETQNSWDRPIDLDAFWAAVTAVAQDTTKVVLFSSLTHAFELVPMADRHGWPLRDDLVWNKSVATGFYNVAHRPLRDHELILVFYREEGTYNPQMTDGHPPAHSARRRAGKVHAGLGEATRPTEYPGGSTQRYPRSVLNFPSVGTTDPSRRHSAQKPVPLLRWLIRSYTLPGDVVVDPCAGSFAVGEAARDEGCIAVGIDTEREHCEKAAAHLGLTEVVASRRPDLFGRNRCVTG